MSAEKQKCKDEKSEAVDEKTDTNAIDTTIIVTGVAMIINGSTVAQGKRKKHNDSDSDSDTDIYGPRIKQSPCLRCEKDEYEMWSLMAAR